MGIEDTLKKGKILYGKDLRASDLKENGVLGQFEFYSNSRVKVTLIKLLSYRDAYEVNQIIKIK